MLKIKADLRRLIELTGYTLVKLHPSADSAYDQDGLKSIHNHDFMFDSAFAKAYQRGCLADRDHKIHWRTHIAIWAAVTASKVVGDYVECGVNRGFMSSAIMEYLGWNSMGRQFYLLDTFDGLDYKYVSDDDFKTGAREMNEANLTSYYVKDVESVKNNFAQWQNVHIIKGSVPETLEQVKAEKIAYLHIDMNCSPPEVAAIKFFWEKISPGAVILLDDYAYNGCESQKRAMDTFAHEKKLLVASLPTGQGLLIKPPTS